MALAALLQADPRAAGIERQLRAQQAILAPQGIVIPEQYISEFAQAIVRVWNVADVRDVTVVPTIVRDVLEDQGNIVVERDSSQWINQRGEIVEPDSRSSDGGATTIASSSDGAYNFLARWMPSLKVPVFYVQRLPKRGNVFTGFVLPVAAIGAAVFGLPALIGEAVLGAEAAAANPLAAQAIGQTAVSTALTGGNIERAAAQTAASLVGAGIGDVAGSGLDSAAAGRVTAAATTAALQGKNPRIAAARSILLSGIRMDEVQTDFGELGIAEDAGSILAALDMSEAELQAAGFTGTELLPNLDGSLVNLAGEDVVPSEQVFARSFYVTRRGGVNDQFNNPVIPDGQAASMSPEEIQAELQSFFTTHQGQTENTAAADPARPASVPATAAQGKVPTITDQAKVADALLKTAVSISQSVRSLVTGKPLPYATNLYGTYRPPLTGVGVTRPDGSIVTNNGNGTITTRYPNGQVTTTSSSFAGGSLLGGISNQTLLIGGAVLLAALVLSRR